MVEIETEWNLKMTLEQVGEAFDTVEIETEWNLKLNHGVHMTITHARRNRNRVEFKGILAEGVSLCTVRRNRNRVEFKANYKSIWLVC